MVCVHKYALAQLCIHAVSSLSKEGVIATSVGMKISPEVDEN